MKYNFIALCALTMVLTGSFAASASAYELVDAESRRIDANHTLYMITYKAGFLNREAEFPVTATRKATTSMSVIYQFETASGTVNNNDGMSASVIVSDAEKEDGVFPLTEGKNQLFTLIVVRAGTERLIPEAMRITRIPYILIDDNDREEAIVNEEQLEDHVTPLVK